MDKDTWQATVHRVALSQSQLKQVNTAQSQICLILKSVYLSTMLTSYHTLTYEKLQHKKINYAIMKC